MDDPGPEPDGHQELREKRQLLGYLLTSTTTDLHVFRVTNNLVQTLPGGPVTPRPRTRHKSPT